MTAKQITTTLLLCLFAHQSYGAFPGSVDEIKHLPGQPPDMSFKQYSGYLDGGKGHQMFYWLMESETNPAVAPVVLWLSGGPGASSISDSFIENGPFRVKGDGKT